MKSDRVGCLAPLVHSHIWPDGRVFACSYASVEKPFGNLSDQNFDSIWNGTEYKKFRLDLANGVKREDICSKCINLENNGLDSRRLRYHRTFEELNKPVPRISSTGEVDSSSLIRWDFRFSNLCNMACRTCGPYLSSSWYNDFIALGGIIDSKFMKMSSLPDENIKSALSNIDSVELIHFAGGEPLLLKEHFEIVSKLVESGRAKHVQLHYTTNLSTLKFKDCDFTKLWPEFKEITFCVSLDEIEERAEYWRKGTKWESILKNLNDIVKLVDSNDNFTLGYTPTFSIFNIHRIEEYLEYFFVKHKMFVPHRTYIAFNVLRYPAYFRLDNTSNELKAKFSDSVERCVSILETLKKPIHRISCVDEFKSLVNLVENSKINLDELEEFVKKTAHLDKIRNESIKDVAPDLWDSVFKNSNYQKYYDEFIVA